MEYYNIKCISQEKIRKITKNTPIKSRLDKTDDTKIHIHNLYLFCEKKTLDDFISLFKRIFYVKIRTIHDVEVLDPTVNCQEYCIANITDTLENGVANNFNAFLRGTVQDAKKKTSQYIIDNKLENTRQILSIHKITMMQTPFLQSIINLINKKNENFYALQKENTDNVPWHINKLKTKFRNEIKDYFVDFLDERSDKNIAYYTDFINKNY